MNVYAIFADHVREAVAALSAEGLVKSGLDLARVVVEPPRDATHGDLATNAAMVLSKDAGLKPRDLAEKIAGKLKAVPGVARVDVAGPGFINIALDAAFWPKVLAAALTKGLDFGRSRLGADEKVNVEYVSANPTGPMHVGHCRGAVFGDAMARLLAFAGFAVTKEYYINDAGAQVDVLGRSVFLRYREAVTGEKADIPDGLYPGDYLVAVGQQLAEMHGGGIHGRAGERVAAGVPLLRHRLHDGDDPRRPHRPRHRVRRVLLRAFAGLRRGGQGGRHHRGVARVWRGL